MKRNLNEMLCMSLCLMLCVAICFATTAPSIMKSDMQFGGLVHGDMGHGDVSQCLCTGTTAGQSCGWTAGCGGSQTWCDVSESGSGRCSGAGNDPCTQTGDPELECGEDAICS